MKEIKNDVKQLEEEVSSLADQVIALQTELESHERLIIKKDLHIAELHKTIDDLHGVLVASK